MSEAGLAAIRETLVGAGDRGCCRIDLIGSCTLIDASVWDGVVLASGGGIFHSHAWHAALEQAPPGRTDVAHLLAYHGDELVGVCPAYLVHDCPRLNHAFSLDRPRDLSIEGPILLSHSLAALAGGPVAVPGHSEALDALDEGLRRAAGLLAAWAYGYANVSATPLSGRLLGRGFAVAEVATDYQLTVEWDSPAAYWAAMRSRRRRTLRTVRARTEAAGIRVASEPVPPDEATRLVHALLSDRGTPLSILPGNFLRAAMRQLAPYERSVVARDNEGTPCAAFIGWQFGTERSMWLAGLDTNRTKIYEPYHAMLAEVVETAIAERVATVDLGRSNGDVKHRYGARPRPLLLALNSPYRDRNALLHLWCRDLEQHHHAVLNGLESASRCC